MFGLFRRNSSVIESTKKKKVRTRNKHCWNNCNDFDTIQTNEKRIGTKIASKIVRKNGWQTLFSFFFFSQNTCFLLTASALLFAKSKGMVKTMISWLNNGRRFQMPQHSFIRFKCWQTRQKLQIQLNIFFSFPISDTALDQEAKRVHLLASEAHFV